MAQPLPEQVLPGLSVLDMSPLVLSLQIALLSTFLTVATGVPAAWVATRARRGLRLLLDSLLSLPLVLPPTVVGLLLVLFLGRNGPLSLLSGHAGTSLLFTRTAAVIAACVVSFPLSYRTVRSAFEQVDRRLFESARSLGASEWRVFWRIACPAAGPGIIGGSVLAFARALGEFGATLMVSGSIPGKTLTVPVAIYRAVEAGRPAEAAIWSGLLLLASWSVMMAVHAGSPRAAGKRQKQQRQPAPSAPHGPRPDAREESAWL